MIIKQELREILLEIASHGGKGLVVGGSVRDFIFDPAIEPKDLDAEVYNLHVEKLTFILENFGKVDQVGRSFGVIKLTTETTNYDFSLPRRENKAGNGTKGFIVDLDGSLSVVEAASRRDFTFNSLAFDPLNGELIDHYNGVEHIKQGVISATSAAFGEDPLRVLRGFQFAGRFGFEADKKTLAACFFLQLEYRYLAKERIWGEWQKWANKSTLPSAGLQFLADCGWLKLYPELAAIQGIPQDPEWHPEGQVFIHTKHVVDAAVTICQREGITGDRRTVIVLASLCHDFGKATHTQFEDGRTRSRGHEQAGEEPTRSFLDRIGCPKAIADKVVPLVTRHLAHISCESDRSVRRLAQAIFPATIEELCFVIEADHSGRPPLAPGLPECAKNLLIKSKELNCNQAPVNKILQGRHLISLGRKPGKEFSEILNRAFEAQLNGEFDCENSGLTWLQSNI